MSAVEALANTSAAGAGNSLSSMSSGDFFKLILTELSKQDPLQPNDTNALLQQIGAVRSIQSDMDLSSNLKSLVDQNEFASASTLVGKTVSGLGLSGEQESGVVRSVTRTDDGALVTLKSGERIPVKNILEIAQTAEKKS